MIAVGRPPLLAVMFLRYLLFKEIIIDRLYQPVWLPAGRIQNHDQLIGGRKNITTAKQPEVKLGQTISNEALQKEIKQWLSTR